MQAVNVELSTEYRIERLWREELETNEKRCSSAGYTGQRNTIGDNMEQSTVYQSMQYLLAQRDVTPADRKTMLRNITRDRTNGHETGQRNH